MHSVRRLRNGFTTLRARAIEHTKNKLSISIELASTSHRLVFIFRLAVHIPKLVAYLWRVLGESSIRTTTSRLPHTTPKGISSLSRSRLHPTRIPYHLLHAAPSSPLQTRPYSSGSRNENDPSSNSGNGAGNNGGNSGTSQSPSSDVAQGLGFQSLRGLFSSTPPRGRYSRAREEPEIRKKPGATAKSEASAAERAERVEESDLRFAPREESKAVEGGSVTDQTPSGFGTKKHTRAEHARTLVRRARASFRHKGGDSAAKTRGEASDSQGENDQLEAAGSWDDANGTRTDDRTSAKRRMKGRGRTITRKAPVGSDNRGTFRTFNPEYSPDNPNRTVWRLRPRDSSAVARRPLKVDNPFKGNNDARESAQTSEQKTGAFGLGDVEETSTFTPAPEAEAEADAKKAATASSTDTSTTTASASSTLDPASSTSPATDPPRLTHLNSLGEAHMVDVSFKPATTRTAVAFAYVRFSQPETYPLVTIGGANKKGDVLATARIAGIMAAKKTSDLIPLCHPLPLSSVEVEVVPEHPYSANKQDRPSQSREAYEIRSQVMGNKNELQHGVVTITTTARCTGPTGVEMEALTAALVSAATVVDMCKAVDQRMKVERGGVVYKAGGRSGIFIDRKWWDLVGDEWFSARGLEVPPAILRTPSRLRNRLGAGPSDK